MFPNDRMTMIQYKVEVLLQELVSVLLLHSNPRPSLNLF